jgi:hypothetical protein
LYAFVDMSTIKMSWSLFPIGGRVLHLSTINKHVPTKRTLARHSHPWMNTRLRRLCKQKQRAYTKAKRSKATKDWK